ncbi:MAG: hypothetical protein OXL41_04980, partial [Nitrospinae bacterium]|nr:hypothetical protein [Nitrospinota bacterium]
MRGATGEEAGEEATTQCEEAESQHEAREYPNRHRNPLILSRRVSAVSKEEADGEAAGRNKDAPENLRSLQPRAVVLPDRPVHDVH